MGKKMKFPFLSKINSSSSSSSSAITDCSGSNASWAWPVYCQQPKTLSFRTENLFKNFNGAYLEASLDVVDTNSSSTPANESNFFTNSSTSESASFSTASDDQSGISGECIETVIKGLRSERLFFKPGETSSILEEAVKLSSKAKKAATKVDNDDDGDDEDSNNKNELFPFKESVVLSMDSQDPYVDFKKSMEEMVEAHGLKDWESFEELLCCYLKVNGKSNHGYIIGAFVDLLVGLAFTASSSTLTTTTTATNTTTTSSDQSYCSCSHSPSSPLSFYTSSNLSDDSSSTPCVSSLEVEEVDSCLSSSLQVKH